MNLMKSFWRIRFGSACLVKEKVLYIEEWPKNYQSLFYQLDSAKEHDYAIQKFAEKQALRFIDKNENSREDDTKKQVQTLRFLLYHNRFNETGGYFCSNEINDFLKEVLGVKSLTSQTFRNSVIAKLRDEGVLISSCNEGYKIPTSCDDIIKYVEQINLKVILMLNRLDRSRKQVKILTDNKLDIIDYEAFGNLKALLGLS